MESNRDEAKRSLQLAIDVYRSLGPEGGTAAVEKAKRLTRKSLRLYPSEEAEGKYISFE